MQPTYVLHAEAVPVAMLPWRDPCLCRPPEVCLAMPPEFCPAMLDLVPMLLEDVCRATPA